jgi:hypothetical protein
MTREHIETMAADWLKLISLHKEAARHARDVAEQKSHLRVALRLARLVRQAEAIAETTS